MATFGERFKSLRVGKNLTQQKLADLFFLNKSSISRYEQDKQIPEMELLEKFSIFFDCSVDFLLGTSDVKKILNPEEQALHKKKSELFDMIVDELKSSGQITDDMSFEEQYKIIKQRIELVNDIFGKMKKIENKE